MLGVFCGLMLLIGGLTFAVFRLSPEGDCVDKLRSEAPSPDGRAIAAVYEHVCGGEVATRVALRRPQTSFVARGDVAAFAGRAQVELRWDGARALAVVTAAQPMLAENAWHDVAVELRRSR